MIVNQAALAGIYQSFSTIFAEAFAGVKSMAELVATVVPSTGAQVDYKWLGSFPGMRKWMGERVISNLSAFKYTIVNEKFEATIGVDRDDIEDDQIGVYKPMIQGLAHSAATHPDELVYALMKLGFSEKCYDGQYFFDTDHPVGSGDSVASVSNFGGGAGTPWFLLDLSRPIKPMLLQIRRKPEFVALDDPKDEQSFMRNKYLYGVDDRKAVGFGLWQLAYGSKDTLNAANFEAALTAMSSLKNDEGKPLGVRATHLFVPPTLLGAGKDVVEKQFLANGESNKWFKTVELVDVPWLA
ncbi:Mu-like prophage major head subunit gpT family protein [uncultured Pseudodesulfovibrio sp.]|uniref:Mu-like prophage major head subunit gpT family protein n=1 Tax=uncultured Pseudodesulfovibrio sp. TaxID=2035858 RepID=UPI0029C7BF8B|nr:Mu-like prophage major head subunit gpT family protein [uncultured Pseudodesulfovibrio sp.]